MLVGILPGHISIQSYSELPNSDFTIPNGILHTWPFTLDDVICPILRISTTHSSVNLRQHFSISVWPSIKPGGHPLLQIPPHVADWNPSSRAWKVVLFSSNVTPDTDSIAHDIIVPVTPNVLHYFNVHNLSNSDNTYFLVFEILSV